MKRRPIFDKINKIFDVESSSFFINSDKYSKLKKKYYPEYNFSISALFWRQKSKWWQYLG